MCSSNIVQHHVSSWHSSLSLQLSELSVNRGGNSGGVATQMFVQGMGMFTGAVIMLFIAIYEHDIENLINGSF